MKIQEIGGEFQLLERLRTKFSDVYGHEDVNLLIKEGDDGTILKGGADLCLSVDSFVEDRHFSLDYYSAEQIGRKVIESSVSDLIAMRSIPKYVLIALTVSESTSVEFIEDLYLGISHSCKRLNCAIVGGDLTSTQNELVISVTAIGNAPETMRQSTRAGARVGDRICVSGALGGSLAGLRAFQKKLNKCEDAKERHLYPECRFDSLEWSSAPFTSCIDISDGLSNELHHISRASGHGMHIVSESIPIDPCVGPVAEALGELPLAFALHGGEDFELLFTMTSQEELPLGCIEIGVVTSGSNVLLETDGNRIPLIPLGSNRFLPSGGI